MALTKGFRDAAALLRHFQKHRVDFGVSTVSEYLALADTFLGSPISADVHEGTRKNGDIVRYNPITNEFGVITSSGAILTYFKPNLWNKAKYPTSLDYFKEQCKC